jgi:Zn-dependent protease
MRIRILGFPLFIEKTTWLMAGFILLSRASGGPEALLDGLLWVLLAYGSVLAHELGHALSASRFGLGPVEMSLHGLGGLTRHARPATPWQGLFLSLAGPAVNFGIALLSLAAILLMRVESAWLLSTLQTLLVANVFWAAFNLLPMLPLDGAKVTLHGLHLLGVSDLTGLRITLGLTLAIALLVAAGGVWFKLWFLVLFAFLSLKDVWPILGNAFRR